MISWILKMLLKVMKPFAKIMIFQAIVSSLMEAVGEDETAEEPIIDPDETTGE